MCAKGVNCYLVTLLFIQIHIHREWTVKVLQKRMLGVFLRKYCLVGKYLPVDAKIRVEDVDASVGLWGIEVVALVLADGGFAEGGKDMGKAFRDEDLTVVVFTEFYGYMLAIGRRALADIYRYIEHLDTNAGDELALCVRGCLEVEASHHAIG